MSNMQLTPSSSGSGRRNSGSAPGSGRRWSDTMEDIIEFAQSPLANKLYETGKKVYSETMKRKGKEPEGGYIKKRYVIPGISKLRVGGNNENSVSTRVAKVTNRRSKKVSIRKPKKVRITRKFRAKVNKALEPSMCFGKYMETTTGQFGFGLTLGNQQSSDRFTPSQGNACGSVVFSPVQVLDVASVLFNGKTATKATKATITGGNQTDFGNNTFDPRTVKVTVKNQYYSFVLRNNTKRTWIIQMYECSPKMKQSIIDDGDGLTQWVNVLQNTVGNAQNVTQKNINLAGATANTLYSQPMDNPLFLKYWNIEKHDIVLDPGQTYDHFMQGPSGVYDFAKFWKPDNDGAANIFFNIQPKFTRHVFFTARLDLVTSEEGNCGRWGIAAADEKLLLESKYYYNIGLPSQTGGTLLENNSTTSGTSFVLGQKRDCYYKVNWDAANTPPTVRVEEQTGVDNIF